MKFSRNISKKSKNLDHALLGSLLTLPKYVIILLWTELI